MSNTNIDFDFIHQLEGFSYKGYVPAPETSKSGVTVAAGFDIGQCSAQEITSNFTQELADKLLPYVGKIKQEACAALEHIPLTITDDDAKQITDFTTGTAVARLNNEWNNSASSLEFDQLATQCATVIASVAFQYGSLPKRTPNFWYQVTEGHWHDALANLRNFGDKYPTRRNKEADLLESWLKTQS